MLRSEKNSLILYCNYTSCRKTTATKYNKNLENKTNMLLHIEDTFNYPSVICLIPEMIKKPHSMQFKIPTGQ